MNHIVQQALSVLEKGGVILYPSDTVWGLACDATNQTAVKKIFDIKKRSYDKSVLIQVLNLDMLSKYAIIDFDISKISDQYQNEPLTIIYPYKMGLAPYAIASDKTLAARIVHDDFTTTLLTDFKKPIVSTSANISGSALPCCFENIDLLIKNKVDFIVPLKQNEKMQKTSRIIKILDNTIKVLR